MSAGDVPVRPVPGAPGPPRAPVGAAVDETDEVLQALAALPADAPVGDQAALLEDVQERLARRLSGAVR